MKKKAGEDKDINQQTRDKNCNRYLEHIQNNQETSQPICQQIIRPGRNR